MSGYIKAAPRGNQSNIVTDKINTNTPDIELTIMYKRNIKRCPSVGSSVGVLYEGVASGYTTRRRPGCYNTSSIVHKTIHHHNALRAESTQ